MNVPQRTDANLCPECDALVGAGVHKCWLCGAAMEKLSHVVAVKIVSPTRPRRDSPGFSFSLSSLMIVVTLICVSLGAFSIAPGLGIVFVIVVTPAFIRTAIGVARQEAAGRPLDADQKILAFSSSVLVVTVIGISAGVAFFATCFAGGWGAFFGIAAVNPSARYGIIGWSVGIGLLLGILVGGLVGYKLLRRLWPHRESRAKERVTRTGGDES